jgi:hypothetical protein
LGTFCKCHRAFYVALASGPMFQIDPKAMKKVVIYSAGIPIKAFARREKPNDTKT